MVAKKTEAAADTAVSVNKITSSSLVTMTGGPDNPWSPQLPPSGSSFLSVSHPLRC